MKPDAIFLGWISPTTVHPKSLPFYPKTEARLVCGAGCRKSRLIDYRIVENFQCRSAPLILDRQGVVGNGRGPKEPIRRNRLVKAVQLVGRTGRAHRARIQVDSEVDERAMVLHVVGGEVVTGHKSHIGSRTAQ